MNFKPLAVRIFSLASASVLTLGIEGCADEAVRSPATGPGAENPAAASGGNVVPAIGGAGNGGGVSGGGAGAGAGGQGAR